MRIFSSVFIARSLSSRCVRSRRDLHSFPTRRSSDLGKIDRQIGHPEGLVGGDARPRQRGDDLFTQAGEPPACGLTLDRKSTRLNSSHRTISYAVFCLKKKTTSPSLARL